MRRRGPLGSRPELNDRFAVAGDHDLLALQRTIDQLGERVFSVGNAIHRHGILPQPI
jgi:hypothetical protein